MNSIIGIAQFLIDKGERLSGLEDERIKEIENHFDVELPKTYVSFLRIMGTNAGNYMKGSSVFYNEIFELKNWAEELVRENRIQPLPDDSFVFWMHQGYQMAYFKLCNDDDPPVYYYSEGQQPNEFKLKEKSVTDFFIWQLALSYSDAELQF